MLSTSWAAKGAAIAGVCAAALGIQGGNVPINDLGAGFYKGFQGGLYPGGVNSPPAAHLRAALAAAENFVPRDAAGNASASGWIVLISIGMSNTTHEFAPFERQEDLNVTRNGRVVILNTALGGQTAAAIKNPNAAYWTTVMDKLASMGLSANQVGAAWLKEANANPPNDFPGHALVLHQDLRGVAQVLHDKFPNLRIAYCSGRTYGGYATGTLNPEPQAYESSFPVKWMIEDQISGDPALNFNPDLGPVEAPVLVWGPYLWANGTTPRSDGLVWLRADFEADGVHPSPAGEHKVANMLSAYFASDAMVRPWYAKTPDVLIRSVDAIADAHVASSSPNSNFGGMAELRSNGGASAEIVYLKFDLRTVARPVRLAKLELRVRNGSGAPRIVGVVSDTSWTESGINYSNRPAADGGVAGQSANASRDGTIAVNVTQAVNADADGVVSFALQTSSTTLATYASKEGGEAPRLTMTLNDPTAVLPESFSFGPGVHVSGGLSDLFASENLRVQGQVNIAAEETGDPVTLVLEGTSPLPSPSALFLSVEAKAEVDGLGQRVEMFDWVLMQYVEANVRPATTLDSRVVASAPGPPGRFVQAGTRRVRARVGWFPVVVETDYPWRAWCDQAVWTVQP